MFCKWCGADIPNAATKCTRCGKETPALSNCGGFYDLAPKAKRPVAAEPAPQKETVVPVDPVKVDPPKTEKPQKKSSGRKGSGLWLAAICLGVVATIGLLLTMNGKMGNGFAKLDAIHERLDAVNAQLEQYNQEAEPTVAPTVAETAPQEVLLEEQDICIEIAVAQTEVGTEVTTTPDLGEVTAAVNARVLLGNDRTFAAAQIDLNGADNCIGISAAKNQGEQDTLSVTFAIDGSVLAEIAGNAAYQWAYRAAGATEWMALDETVFALSEDGTTVTYSAVELAGLLEGAQGAEFKLTYKRENVKDGSLTLTISGIAVTLEARTDI